MKDSFTVTTVITAKENGLGSTLNFFSHIYDLTLEQIMKLLLKCYNLGAILKYFELLYGISFFQFRFPPFTSSLAEVCRRQISRETNELRYTSTTKPSY